MPSSDPRRGGRSRVGWLEPVSPGGPGGTRPGWAQRMGRGKAGWTRQAPPSAALSSQSCACGRAEGGGGQTCRTGRTQPSPPRSPGLPAPASVCPGLATPGRGQREPPGSRRAGHPSCFLLTSQGRSVVSLPPGGHPSCRGSPSLMGSSLPAHLGTLPGPWAPQCHGEWKARVAGALSGPAPGTRWALEDRKGLRGGRSPVGPRAAPACTHRSLTPTRAAPLGLRVHGQLWGRGCPALRPWHLGLQVSLPRGRRAQHSPRPLTRRLPPGLLGQPCLGFRSRQEGQERDVTGGGVHIPGASGGGGQGGRDQACHWQEPPLWAASPGPSCAPRLAVVPSGLP